MRLVAVRARRARRRYLPDAAGQAASSRRRPEAHPTYSPVPWRRSCPNNLGQQVVIDNRAGASGVIGLRWRRNRPPDGYTLFLGTTTLYAILPNLKPEAAIRSGA